MNAGHPNRVESIDIEIERERQRTECEKEAAR